MQGKIWHFELLVKDATGADEESAKAALNIQMERTKKTLELCGFEIVGDVVANSELEEEWENGEE